MRPVLLHELFHSVTRFKGVGPKFAGFLKKLGCRHLVDLYWHMPVGCTRRRWVQRLGDAQYDEIITIVLKVMAHQPPDIPQSQQPYRVRCIDRDGREIDLVYFHGGGSYLLRSLPIGRTLLVSGKFESFYGKWQMTHPDFTGPITERENWQGAEPVYPLTQGLSQKQLIKIIAQALPHCPELPEWLEPSMLAHEHWPSWHQAIAQVHSPQSDRDLDPQHPARRRLAYDELLANQLALLLIRHFQRRQSGSTFRGDGHLRRKLIAQLPFELTPSQSQSLKEIFADMGSNGRMVRLLQGDVGSGKTVVAMLAMLNAVECGTQAALLAPTEILAQQHAATLTPWAEALGLKVGLLTSKGKGKKQVLEELDSGEIHIAVGTHALIQEGVAFKNLGIAIVDEQHRFGVDQRLKIGKKGEKIDMLIMTATPIPRTLALAAYGDLATSKLTEKPAGRQEIATRVMPLTRLDSIVEKLKEAMQKGRKVYWVCPLIEESEALDLAAAQDRYAALLAHFPGKVGLVHGRMKSAEKDEVMQSFIQGNIQILVATTVIEVGVHVADATIMIIEHAERFGLAQLHQLRGRIGRGLEASTCVLLYDGPLTESAKARLKIMRDTNDGFLIAEEDWRLRGGGDTLGFRQSGLPSLKVANYTFHQELLTRAHKEAELIIKQDPDLDSARGQALRTLLYLFEREQTVGYLLAG
ncbi:MAG: ATP-dependent DNA helicase RecG [Pseudomonadota bacterium]